MIDKLKSVGLNMSNPTQTTPQQVQQSIDPAQLAMLEIALRANEQYMQGQMASAGRLDRAQNAPSEQARKLGHIQSMFNQGQQQMPYGQPFESPYGQMSPSMPSIPYGETPTLPYGQVQFEPSPPVDVSGGYYSDLYNNPQAAQQALDDQNRAAVEAAAEAERQRAAAAAAEAERQRAAAAAAAAAEAYQHPLEALWWDQYRNVSNAYAWVDTSELDRLTAQLGYNPYEERNRQWGHHPTN